MPRSRQDPGQPGSSDPSDAEPGHGVGWGPDASDLTPLLLLRSGLGRFPRSAPNEIRPWRDLMLELSARARRGLVPRGPVGIPHTARAGRGQMPRRDLGPPARSRTI
jgi:hypothetical protein